MNDATRPIAHFLGFTGLLRRAGFAVAPEQTMAWLAAIELLGPREVGDIRRSARATLGPPPERFAEFDALFDAHFLGVVVPGLEGEPSDEEPIRAAEDSSVGPEPIFSDETREVRRQGDHCRAAFGTPFCTRRRGRDAAAFRPPGPGARAAAARLPLALGARTGHRHAAHVPRCHAPRR